MKLARRYVPLIPSKVARALLGFAALTSSFGVAVRKLGTGQIVTTLAIATAAWLVAVLATDKYVNKYPQRFYWYHAAAHAKAAATMFILLAAFSCAVGETTLPRLHLAVGLAAFVLCDAVLQAPRRPDVSPMLTSAALSLGASPPEPERAGDREKEPASGQGLEALRAALAEQRGAIGDAYADAIESAGQLLAWRPGDRIRVAGASAADAGTPAKLIVATERFNDIRRINVWLLSCAKNLPLGGILVGRYAPLEHQVARMHHNHTGPTKALVFGAHFFWKRALPTIPWVNSVYFLVTRGRDRCLSKAEMWGRLAYCGFHVIQESSCDGEAVFVARRMEEPVQNRKPSYYPIVGLEKIGMGGHPIRTHKVRTMFPFSEFLQKRVYEDHGLLATGKFANDFRLTEYGPLLRRYWIDELPQLFDWLHGELKLVGIRATSRQFLSLYPLEFIDLYVQIKPGVVPPIFDESTNGFKDIVRVEMDYLLSYAEHPLRTDVRYFLKTFTDIVFRGIRSK